MPKYYGSLIPAGFPLVQLQFSLFFARVIFDFILVLLDYVYSFVASHPSFLLVSMRLYFSIFYLIYVCVCICMYMYIYLYLYAWILYSFIIRCVLCVRSSTFFHVYICLTLQINIEQRRFNMKPIHFSNNFFSEILELQLIDFSQKFITFLF